jgi:glycine betaine/proline transport system substrate-binding protein
MTEQSLTLAHPDEPRHEAAAAAVARVLEAHELEVVIRAVERPAVARLLERGEIDLFATAWLPDVDADWTASGVGMEAMGGVLYRPQAMWSVTAAVPGTLATIADLAKPEFAGGLERILLVPASLEMPSRRAAEAYGLSGAGFGLEILPDENAYHRARALVDAGSAAVVPNWHPGALAHGGVLRPLGDPLGALGTRQEARLLLRRGLREVLDPDLLDELDELTLGNPVVSAMEHAMRRDDMTAADAAEAWQRGKLTPRA